MTLPRSSELLVASEFYLRPLRRGQHIRPHRTPRHTLGPITIRGRRVVLRSPRLADASEWSRLRIQDRAWLEPYWESSELSWEHRHSEQEWVRRYLRMRSDERRGRALHLILTVDGRFAGQCDLEHIDSHAGSAEIGLWMSSDTGGFGIASGTAHLFLQFAFAELHLKRLTAAICIDNVRARHLALSAGLEYEGTMSDYLDVGGRRRDHDLWALTEQMWHEQCGTGTELPRP